VCKAAQRDRETSLDRCAVRVRAGDESEEAKQGRQDQGHLRGLACRYLRGICSALHPGRRSPPRAESPSASRIQIRLSFHPPGTIPITRSFPAFLPNWSSARSRTRRLLRCVASSVRQDHTVRDLAAGNREWIAPDDDTVLAAARGEPMGLMRPLDRTTIDEIRRVPDLSTPAMKKSVDDGSPDRPVSVDGLSHYIRGGDDGSERYVSCRRNPRPKNRKGLRTQLVEKSALLQSIDNKTHGGGGGSRTYSGVDNT